MIEDNFEYQPWSQQSEEAVIGVLLTNTELFADASDLITSADFYSPAHQTIFRTFEILSDQGKPIDVPLVAEYLTQNNILEFVGGLPYLAELAMNKPSASNLMFYAENIKQKTLEREVLKIADQMQETIKNEDIKPEDKVNAALGLVSNFDSKEVGEKSKDEVLKNVIGMIEANASQKGLSGIDTGFVNINQRTNGLQKTDLIIVAARPAMGKTTFAMNIAETAATNGDAGAVLAFSLEMSAEQLMMKSVCSLGKIEIGSIKNGTCSPDEYSRMNPAFQNLKAADIVIDDRAGLSMQQIKAKALKVKRKHGQLKMIVVDYIQLCKDSSVARNASRTEEVGSISRNLKSLAKDLDCPVIALSQLNRKLEDRSDKRPRMADLRDSGEIEQDADIIMFLYRDEVYNEETAHKGICEVITAKHRHGETGNDYIASKLNQSRFENLKHEIQIEESKEPGGFEYKPSI